MFGCTAAQTSVSGQPIVEIDGHEKTTESGSGGFGMLELGGVGIVFSVGLLIWIIYHHRSSK